MKIDTTTKVFNLMVRTEKNGVCAPLTKLAAKLSLSQEGVRYHVLKLLDEGSVKKTKGNRYAIK